MSQRKMSKSKSKSATPLFDNLILHFQKKKTVPISNLASALKALKHFVGFDEIKETLSKQIQFFICHHLTQIPTRRSKRKRKTRSDLRSAKRPRFGSTDSEEEEEEDTSEEPSDARPWVHWCVSSHEQLKIQNLKLTLILTLTTKKKRMMRKSSATQNALNLWTVTSSTPCCSGHQVWAKPHSPRSSQMCGPPWDCVTPTNSR